MKSPVFKTHNEKTMKTKSVHTNHTKQAYLKSYRDRAFDCDYYDYCCCG